MTPAANGSFLDGVTRQRVLKLLGADGVEAREATLSFADFVESADEIFVVGNYGKVSPVNRIEQRGLSRAPFFRRARAALLGLRAFEVEGRPSQSRPPAFVPSPRLRGEGRV